MVGPLDLHDGGMDKVAAGVVVGAAGEDLGRGIGLGVVEGGRELLERVQVDDGADKVAVGCGVADGQLLRLLDQASLEFGPDGRRHVEARGGAALLALVLERAADGVEDGVFNVGRRMDQVEVLAARLADDARVGFVSALGDAGADLPVQLAEDGRAAGVVERGEVFVGEDLARDELGVAGHELDDVLRQAGLDQDVVEKPVGGDGVVAGLPDDDVAQECGEAGEVSGDGGEVEGADGVDKALERAVLDAVPHAGRIVGGLLGVELLGELDVEAEKVAQLGGGVNLGLPGVLALAQHGGGHDVVAVLSADEVGGLEEDGGAVGKGEGCPVVLGCEGGFDGCVDVLGFCLSIRGDYALVIRWVDLFPCRPARGSNLAYLLGGSHGARWGYLPPCRR